MSDDEVLAAGLADDARIGPVRRDVLAHGPPQVLEGRGRAGEVDAAKVGVCQRDVGHGQPVAGQHVDHPWRHARLLEQPHGEVCGELLGDRRLPQHGVAHQCRCGGKVGGDCGEVEWRDGVDEPLERAVVGAVPDALGVRHRLLAQDLGAVVDVEAPEVDQLAGSVDLGLPGRLRLPQHGGGVEGLPPRTGCQLGGLEQNRRAVLERHGPPCRCRLGGRLDGVLGVLAVGAARDPEHLLVVVRLDDGELRAVAPPLLTADGRREISLCLLQLDELLLERSALGAAGGVVEVRLVDRCGNGGVGVHEGICHGLPLPNRQADFFAARFFGSDLLVFAVSLAAGFVGFAACWVGFFQGGRPRRCGRLRARLGRRRRIPGTVGGSVGSLSRSGSLPPLLRRVHARAQRGHQVGDLRGLAVVGVGVRHR